MGDWIGLAAIMLLIAAATIGLKLLSRRHLSSEEEFEKRAAEGTSLASAGFQAINGLLNPSADKGQRAVAEVKRGRFQTKKKEGKGLGQENKGEK